ncbi:MAG: DEAD/DEAH box helicase, partial [Candidatus Electrothrix sp. AUS1_2]|nr:DEAD/DEAH box helicase [Candidatus Electrothrix sp. AUS1_2]
MNNLLPLIDKLEITSAQFQLPGKPVGREEALEESEINKLISYASILSLSESPDEKNLSYEIITRLLEIRKGTDHKLIHSAEVILSRLGNFPGRQLLRERFQSDHNEIPSFLKLECLSREVENSVFLHEDKAIHLTDFQYKFFTSLQEEKALSISAPTSAGKSFVLGLNLIKKIREKESLCVVYIVPTRALITEVSIRIRDSLREYNLKNIIIRTAPFPVSKEITPESIIYVLTQERLINYLSGNFEEMPPITSVVIDEAHEIQKGKRGILLQSAIDYLLKKYPKAEILFASPLIKNPGYFFSIFNILDNGKFFTETISPVSQNTLLVSEVYRKPKQLEVELL